MSKLRLFFVGYCSFPRGFEQATVANEEKSQLTDTECHRRK